MRAVIYYQAKQLLANLHISSATTETAGSIKTMFEVTRKVKTICGEVKNRTDSMGNTFERLTQISTDSERSFHEICWGLPLN